MTNDERKRVLKEIIRDLHRGASPESVRSRFKEILSSASPTEIAQLEEELIREGLPREQIQSLCDIHLAVFKESLDKQRVEAPPGHPIRILMEEHSMVLGFADMLRELAKRFVSGAPPNETDLDDLDDVLHHLKESESHYVREENVLFPYLEKHGITQPPAVMWTEHDKIREMKKSLYALVDAWKSEPSKRSAADLRSSSTSLGEMLSSHFYKENNILFPTAMKVIGDAEWRDVRAQFDEIGYCCFTPEQPKPPAEAAEAHAPPAQGISLGPGVLLREELEAILNTLPVDVTFVDKDDTVRYFTQGKDRIFVRTAAVIGRKVQQCHPQKSLHVVNQILDDFRNGRREVAEFWIDLKGRLVHIRYFPVRNQAGAYLGCIEVSQDVTQIRKLEGEKRLLS